MTILNNFICVSRGNVTKTNVKLTHLPRRPDIQSIEHGTRTLFFFLKKNKIMHYRKAFHEPQFPCDPFQKKNKMCDDDDGKVLNSLSSLSIHCNFLRCSNFVLTEWLQWWYGSYSKSTWIETTIKKSRLRWLKSLPSLKSVEKSRATHCNLHKELAYAYQKNKHNFL